MLDKLKSGDFTPYLNQKFRIHMASMEPLEVELIEVAEFGSDPVGDEASGQRRPFSIVLRGPRDTYLPQRIYPVEHAEIGRLDLFLVPLGPDQEGMRYEAVFA